MLNKITLKICILALFISSHIFLAESQITLNLHDATALAIQHNPDLAQMQARADAMATIPSQVSSLPDPTISFNARNLPTNTFNTAQENMTLIEPGISPSFPFPGKLALRATGSGADVTHRIAAPVLGGMLTALVLSLLVFPVIYSLVLQYQKNRISAHPTAIKKT